MGSEVDCHRSERVEVAVVAVDGFSWVRGWVQVSAAMLR